MGSKLKLFLSGLCLLTFISCSSFSPAPQISVEHDAKQIVFAVIGDFGESGPGEEAVAKMVKSWSPNFIITVGDNNYLTGSQATIDENIGRYYHEFISPYIGKFGSGDPNQTNRFFPALGNHDWISENAKAHFDYFQLPGNERYYDFIWGPVHFFCIDSDSHEPHGITSFSAQGRWLKKKLTASKSRFKIVYFHHSPYSSAKHGSNATLQWPFQEWGASIVLTGHDHVYERLDVNGFPYIIDGIGGREIYPFKDPVPGSLVRYNKNFGALKVTANAQKMKFEFYSISDGLVDTLTLPQ